MSESKTLTSIQQLAQDSWDLFKQTWVAYLKLVGLTVAYIILALIVGVLLILPLSFVAGGSLFQLFNQPTPFTIITFILFVLWLLVLFVSFFLIEIAFPIASIFILQGKKTSPIFDLIKSTKPFFLPVIITILLSGFLAVGGMFLFVIPGLLITFLFTFVLYEVVISGHKGLTALKHSYFMVKSNFWEVLVRLVVLELAILIVTSFLRKVAAGDGLLSLVSFLFSLFASWYGRAYVFLLYKEVRARTTFPEKISINWIWIVSVVGWGIILLLFIAIASGAMQFPTQPQPMHRMSPGAV